MDRGNDAVAFPMGSAPVEAGRICATHLQTSVVALREISNQFISDDSQQAIGSTPGAMSNNAQVDCVSSNKGIRERRVS